MKLPVPTVLASVAGAALIGLLVYGIGNQAANRSLDEALAHGQRPLAPSASRTLPSLTGSRGGSIASYRGKVVLLNFWASWCPGCQEEAPLLERTQRQLERNGGTVLGVTYQDAASDSRRFVRQHRLTFPSVHDVSGELAGAFGTRQLPESFLIDREGRVEAIERGAISAAFAKRAVALAKST